LVEGPALVEAAGFDVGLDSLDPHRGSLGARGRRTGPVSCPTQDILISALCGRS
jgi:hypothetical protein